MSVKIHTVEELKKLSLKDSMGLLTKTQAQLAHEKLRVRSKENKQSHLIGAYKKQAARIQTINRSQNA